MRESPESEKTPTEGAIEVPLELGDGEKIEKEQVKVHSRFKKKNKFYFEYNYIYQEIFTHLVEVGVP